MATTVSSQLAKNSRVSILLLVGILLLSAFLRLFRIADYMTFLGDEGRDVLIVKHLLEGDWVGLGPTASVGGFFLGPIYYYFMAPFLWLFHFDPVGPAVMVALFGIATVFLVYWVGKEWLSEKAGLFAATLYGVSPLVIAYSRSSWNPNLMPFFSLLTLFVLFKAVEKHSRKLFVTSGILLGITMQLHYLATFLAVIMAAFVFASMFRKLHTLVKNYLFLSAGFIIGFSPFLAFEITHGFPNITTVIKFMFGTTGETGFAGGKLPEIIGNVFFRMFGRLVMRFPPPEQVALGAHPNIAIWYQVTIFIAIAATFLLFYQWYKRFKERSFYVRRVSLLVIWFSMGILLFGFYKKPIYDYYFGFMFPLPFLLVGNLLATLYKSDRLRLAGKGIVIIVFAALVWFNLDGRPFRYSANRQLAQVRGISEFVLQKAEGRPFNFALITGQNSDHAYRYFFELEGNKPVTIEYSEKDPARQTVTDQLLIVCEDPRCQPLGNSLWEVAGFGRAEIAEGPLPVSVVKVYKLVHYKGE